MKKTLTKRILIACSIALVFMILVIFSVQSLLMQKTAANTASTRIDDVISKLAVNDAETQNIIDQLNGDFISKADSFAEMIALDPSIIDNLNTLKEIAVMLDVDELHVTDEMGVILWGTVPEYYGFDFATSDQAKEFIPILNDPSLKIAQDAQPNGAEGKYFQYVGVARKDKTGIVQVGITPTRLQNQIEKTSIANVLADMIEESSVGDEITLTICRVDTKNNYSISWTDESDGKKGEGIFNGDIGVIEYINKNGAYLEIKFDGSKTARYEFSQLEEIWYAGYGGNRNGHYHDIHMDKERKAGCRHVPQRFTRRSCCDNSRMCLC